MLGVIARVIAGTVLGVLFLCVMAFGLVADALADGLTDDLSRQADDHRRGTGHPAGESMQRVLRLGGKQT